MIFHDCQQGTQKWLQLRSGIPTASEFDKIITPGGKASTSFDSYLHGLIAERIMKHPRLQAVSTWMDRGTAMEAEAVEFYEFQRECSTEKIGFVTNDEQTIGASPDRLCSDDGLLEIKCPAEHTHVGYLLAGSGASVDKAYKVQVQGQLWITERRWVDVLSYHPEMPPALFRVERDEAFIGEMAKRVMEFSRVLENMSLDLRERGVITDVIAKEPGSEFIGAPEMAWAMSREYGDAA